MSELILKSYNNKDNFFMDNENMFNYVPTESKVLNSILGGGWCTNELYMIIAPSGNGKSTFFRRATIDLCKANQKVVYLSFEETGEQVLNSICALACGIKYQKKPSNYSKQNIKDMMAFSETYLNNLRVDNLNREPTKEELIKYVLAMIKSGYKYIVIDYLGCLDADSTEGTFKYLKDITNDLEKLAIEENVGIITGAQTNRLILNALKEKDFDPRSIDYSYIEKSIGMAQKCTVGISLFGHEVKNSYYRYINVWKNRNEGILRCLYYKENENDYTRSYKESRIFNSEWLNKDEDNKS